MLESVHSWFASIVYVTQRSSRAAGSVLSRSIYQSVILLDSTELSFFSFEKHEDSSVGVGGVDTR